MAAAAKHKEALVHTAMRLFRQQGYAATGLQQILTESGAPKGSLYHYFPGGKEQLAEAAVRLASELIGQMLSKHAARCSTVAEFVAAYCATMAGWMEESGFRSGCPVATTLLETTPHSPQLTQAGNDAFDHWAAIIAGVFADGGASAAEARTKANNLVASMEGALLLARVRQNSQPITDVAASCR